MHALRQSLRSLWVALAGGTIVWAALTLPSAWTSLPGNQAVARVIAGDSFKPSSIDDLLAAIQPQSTFVGRSATARAEAMTRFMIGQELVDRRPGKDSDLDASIANRSLRESLALCPVDSFLWLMLYSLETTRVGFDNSVVHFLQRSYATGPVEGWIALHRNKLALAAFPSLDASLQERVVFEFAAMVDSDLTDAAVSNLTTVGWPHRAPLLAALHRSDIISREALAKRLARGGFKVAIPGIDLEDRPWK